MFQALGRFLERGDHGQDRLAVLVGVHTASREGATVTHPLDPEGDRHMGISRAQEVSVHGVDLPVFRHGARGGDHRLAQDLSAEHPWTGLVRGMADEDVLVGARLHPVQIQQLQQGLGVLTVISHDVYSLGVVRVRIRGYLWKRVSLRNSNFQCVGTSRFMSRYCPIPRQMPKSSHRRARPAET